MKLNLNKQTLVTLSDDTEILSQKLTAQIGGGQDTGDSCNCPTPTLDDCGGLTRGAVCDPDDAMK